MARRRRLYQFDTSDSLANVVMGSLVTLMLALLGLIVWLDATNEDTPPPEDDTVEVVPANGGGATTPAPTESWRDAGRNVAGAGEPSPGGDGGAGGRATPAPAPEDDTEPTPPAATPPTSGDGEAPGSGGEVVVVPSDRGGRRGLFSADDPDRIPAITVVSTPRDERVLHADLNRDGRNERVRAAIVADQVEIAVDRVVDGVWREGPTHTGAAADRLVDLRAADLTGDGSLEVYTWQWVANEGQSVTLWSYGDRDLQRMLASGGCWDGQNTFGLVGALVEQEDMFADRPLEIAAVCEERPLPVQQWSTALYRWQDGRWTFDRRVGKYE